MTHLWRNTECTRKTSTRSWKACSKFLFQNTIICAMFLTGQKCLFQTLIAVCETALELHACVWMAREVWALGSQIATILPWSKKHGGWQGLSAHGLNNPGHLLADGFQWALDQPHLSLVMHHYKMSISSSISGVHIPGMWFLRIFPDFRIFLTNLPLPQPFLERRELATKERKK